MCQGIKRYCDGTDFFDKILRLQQLVFTALMNVILICVYVVIESNIIKKLKQEIIEMKYIDTGMETSKYDITNGLLEEQERLDRKEMCDEILIAESGQALV